MWGKAIAIAAGLCLVAGPAAAGVPGPINPEDGKIAGFTYGADAYNSYTSWSGGMIWIWQFSAQHIGYQGAPAAGVPFYLHAHSAVIAPHAVTGNVLITIDQDAGGLPLRYSPSAAMPARCYLTQFDPVVGVSDRPCRANITVESGQFVVSNLEPLVPGFAFDVELPVVADTATSGTAAMTAMWASEDVGLNIDNVMASVPVTVGVNPNPPNPPATTTTKPLPKALRSYPKVKTLTPKVCKVQSRKVVVTKSGLCKLKGTKGKKHKVVKVRF